MREVHTKRFWSTVHCVYKRKSARRNRAAGRRYTKIWNETRDPTPPNDARKSHTRDMFWDFS